MKAVAHLNIVAFKSAVAELEDKTLRGRPYVIVDIHVNPVCSANRSDTVRRPPCRRGEIVWDVSPEAFRQNIRPGMVLAAAQRRVKDLTVVAPNPASYKKINNVFETIISRYAPVWQNDGAGNIYLDLTGTKLLFGPAADCVCRITNEIREQAGIAAATAVAANKLVCKVASRAIRPLGLVEVPAGDEASFLAHQDIALLPGMGPKLLHTAKITGFREIGELAALSDEEALSLFGKKGLLLRDTAKGIDYTPVDTGKGHRVIKKKAELNEDLIDEGKIHSILATLAEHGGLEMRNEKLGMRKVRLWVLYSDGMEAEGFEKSKLPLVLDKEIFTTACTVYKKIVTRRIRIRSMGLCLEDLTPLGYQPDLFEIEHETKNRRLQQAIDVIQNRYGAGSIMRAMGINVK